MSQLWHKAFIHRNSVVLARDGGHVRPPDGQKLCSCWECGRKYLPPTITPGFCSLKCQVRALKSNHVPGAYK